MTADETTHSNDALPSVSLVVPTYREAENIPELIRRVEAVRTAHALRLEMLILDDNSCDGTVEAVAEAGRDWVKLVVRTGERGLSAAVMEGFTHARHDVLVVMDADLSHPPEIIPDMLRRLEAGAEFVLGSRYAQGGSTAEDWGFLRWVNSQAATLMARPFTRVRDPMSGYFAFRRAALANAAPLNPIGYKIGLELIVKGRFERVEEVPIHFSDRFRGESKLTLREQLRYLRHLRRLADFKYGNLSHFVQFALVGASGVVVNLGVFTVLWLAGVSTNLAYAVAIVLSILSNFGLNRQVTFSYARSGNIWGQLAGFVAGSSLGAAVNYGVFIALLHEFPALERVPQAASLAGILAGLLFNYLVSRYFVFRKK